MTNDEKFEPWNWLLFTQYVEALTAGDPRHKAEELADLISVTMEYIEVLGFDVLEIYGARVGRKAPDPAVVRAVFEKYARAYHEVQEAIRWWPKREPRRS